MSDSIKKWEELQEENDSLKVGEQLEFEFSGDIDTLSINMDIYTLDINEVKTLEDVKLILANLGLQIHIYEEIDKGQKQLIEKGIFKTGNR